MPVMKNWCFHRIIPSLKTYLKTHCGTILLAIQLVSNGIKTIPPCTLGLVIFQTLLHLNIFKKSWNQNDICVQANAVLKDKEYKRLVLSAFEHKDEMHLYYNMVSLLLKGTTLEKIYGTIRYLILIIFLILSTSVYYVLISYVSYLYTNQKADLNECAIGYSAVLFAMKFISARVSPEGETRVLNMSIRPSYAPWIELIAIQFMIPHASFKGHLAGLLVGLTYTDTPFGNILDKLMFISDRRKLNNVIRVIVVPTNVNDNAARS